MLEKQNNKSTRIPIIKPLIVSFLKKYTTYSELEKPYFNFSEVLIFSILPIFAVAIVSFVILFFLGLQIMLVINVGIAAVAAFLFYGLKNATPNGNQNADFLPNFVVISGIIAITNVGGYIFVTYLQTGFFYQMYFYIWLFVMIGIPILYFLIPHLKYKFRLHYQACHFTELWFSIIHDYELVTSDIKIAFLQTKNRLFTEVIVNKSKHKKSIDALDSLSVRERNDCLYDPILANRFQIPKKTDRLKISWYSILDDIYYEDEIDFPFEKLEFVPSEYPSELPKFLRQRLKDNIKLSILRDGKIELLTDHGILMESTLIKSVAINTEKKKQLKESTANSYPTDDLDDKINAIKESDAIQIRDRLKDYLCNWQLTGTVLEDYTIAIRDVRYNHTSSGNIALNTFQQRRLPISFIIIWKGYYWLDIHIDAEKLYCLLQNFEDTEIALSFDFKFDLEKGNAELLIKNNTTVLTFPAWEKTIIESHWKSAKNRFLNPKTN